MIKPFTNPIFPSSPISPGGSSRKWGNIHKVSRGKKMFEMRTWRVDNNFITLDLRGI